MIDLSILALFVPTFLLVSATPGMCMTLAMTMGMTVGVRRTFWMMWGELAGVGLVSVAAVVGVATVMLKYPALFMGLKYLGGGYLLYLGIRMWRSPDPAAIAPSGRTTAAGGPRNLALQGFVTAIANPKGWAFMVSLLPPFISPQRPLAPQLVILVTIILMSEFVCMLAYAGGGRTLRRFLLEGGSFRLMNRVAGTLMGAVGVWLATG